MESYVVFYTLRGGGAGWQFYSEKPTLELAERSALEVMKEYGDRVSVIRLMKHIKCGIPYQPAGIAWK